jgi:hypothetical protein
MITSSERIRAIHATRVVIFILGLLAIYTESPFSDICASLSLGIWLWQAQLVHFELKLIEKWRKRHEV